MTTVSLNTPVTPGLQGLQGTLSVTWEQRVPRVLPAEKRWVDVNLFANRCPPVGPKPVPGYKGSLVWDKQLG